MPRDAALPSWFGELQKPPANVPRSATRPTPLLVDAEGRPIATREAWARRRGEIESRWRLFLGTIPAPRTAPRFDVLERDDRDGVLRQLVRYEAEPGLPVEGYLLQPLEPGTEQSRAGFVVLHSTQDETIRQPAGLAGPADKHIGLHLAKRGHVALCPRCFLWQYGGPGQINKAVEWLRTRHPGVTGMAKMLYDAVRAVDLLTTLPDVDRHRLGAIGHSLGAKEALYLAAFDPRIRTAVASEGGVGISYSNWDAPWYLGPAIHRPGLALDHGQIVALASPRALLIVGGDSADGDASWPYVEAALPVWALEGRPEAVGLFNHRKGHNFPLEAQERSYAWLEWFAGAARGEA